MLNGRTRERLPTQALQRRREELRVLHGRKAPQTSSYYGLNGSGQVGASRQPVTRGLAERPTRRNGSGRVGKKKKPRVTANLAKLKT
jgi:hypothetical protein